MLSEHGMAARGYRMCGQHRAGVRARRLQWILAFEAPELHRIVDLMRDLRALARRHTREETPFFTGPRVSIENLVAKLP